MIRRTFIAIYLTVFLSACIKQIDDESTDGIPFEPTRVEKIESQDDLKSDSSREVGLINLDFNSDAIHLANYESIAEPWVTTVFYFFEVNKILLEMSFNKEDELSVSASIHTFSIDFTQENILVWTGNYSESKTDKLKSIPLSTQHLAGEQLSIITSQLFSNDIDNETGVYFDTWEVELYASDIYFSESLYLSSFTDKVIFRLNTRASISIPEDSDSDY